MPKLKPNDLKASRSATISVRREKLEKRATDCPECGASMPDGADTCSDCGASMDERSTFEIAISSETEVKRWYGTEILKHDSSAVDLSRATDGLPLLLDHDTRMQVGIVEGVRVDADNVTRGTARFSRSAKAQEVRQDVQDEIRKNISVGYSIDDYLEEVRDGVLYINVTRWTPMEASIVPVPADITVGVGRAEGRDLTAITGGEPAEKERSMDPKEQAKQEAEARAALASADASNEARRADEIRGMCDTNGVGALARDFVGSGLSVGAVAARIAEMKRTVAKAQPASEHIKGVVPEKDLRNYSYMRAVRGALALAEGGRFDGLEAEVAEEMRNVALPGIPNRGGVMVPVGQFTSRGAATLDSLTAAKGTELVPEQAGQIIEFLRPKARVIQSGATVLTGLSGPVSFPRQTTGASVSWVAENPAADVANGEPSLGLALLSPKTLMGNIPFTRQLLQQGSIDVEAWARNELSIGHGLAIDRAGIHGTGVSGQPTGIFYAPSVFQSAITSNGSFTASAALLFITSIFDKNADSQSMGWITTAPIAGNLRAKGEMNTQVTDGARPMWDGRIDEGTMFGYAARTTTQMSHTMTANSSLETGGVSHGVVFGNFADMYVAMFGGLELVVDPYSLKKRGVIEVTTFQMADILIRHGESFAKGNCTVA